jgi:hypothetical protein
MLASKATARFMRCDFFDFTPKFKLWVVGNHKPRLDNVDEAMRQRMLLVPFLVQIPVEERGPDLTDKLKAEWPAILRWMLEGCLEVSQLFASWKGWRDERNLHPGNGNALSDVLEDRASPGNGRARCMITAGDRPGGTEGYIGRGLARNELMTPSVKRVGLRSPFFARRRIFLATDVAMGASRSATFSRFKASSKATVMAAVSSGPNAVLISRMVIGISLT